MRPLQRTLTAALALSILDIFMTVSSVAAEPAATQVYRVDHVVDGDTIALRNGQRVRLVQIDTPEVFFGAECYGRAASRPTVLISTAGYCGTSCGSTAR
jgi:endonuclease YncB( thermonuclease family)